MAAMRGNRGGMLHSVYTVLSGSIVAQIIAVAVLPLLTRIYDAEAFGRYQIYISVLSILMIVVAFRYEVAMLNASPGRVFENLVKLTLRLIVATSFVVMLGVIFFGDLVATYLGDLTSVMYWLPPAMLVGGLYQMLTYLPMRNRDYRLSAGSKVVQSTGFAVGGIAGSVAALPGLGLILADIGGRLAAGLWILRRTNGIGSTLLSSQSREEVVETALLFRNFALLTFPGTLMSAVVGAAAPLAFFALFNVEVAGQFALVDRFILLPIGVVASAIAQVFTGDFASLARSNRGDLHRTYRRTLVFLAAIGIVPAVSGMLVAPTLIPWLFGLQWQLAGELCAVGCAIAFVRFLAVPVNMALIICERQPLQLAWEIGRFVLTLGLFAAIYQSEMRNPVSVMAWYAGSVVLSYGMYLALTDRVTRQHAALMEKTEVSTE